MAALWRAKGTQFFDNSGNPLNGGLIRIYDAGTTSTKTVYQDSASATAWSQPITLDSSGRLAQSIFVTSGAFKENLQTSAGVDIYTVDGIPGETILTVDDFAKPNMPVISKSVSYTVLEDDIGSIIQADATGGDLTITLISAVTAGDGAQIGVQNVGTAGIVTVAVPGGQTINGASSIKIMKPRAGGVFTSNAGSWSGPVTDAPYTSLSKTTTYTVDPADVGRTIKADASGGAFTVTLPAVADIVDGFEITVIKTDATTNKVTIDGDGSETINDAANITLDWQWRSVTLRCDGSGWYVIRETAPDKPGKIVIEPTDTLPTGWLWCNGEAVSRTTYARLFNVIGTTYGAGDSSTTFNLPDICGRVVAGQDDMGGIASKDRLTEQTGGVNGDTLGATGGSETHTLTTAQMPPHTHTTAVEYLNTIAGNGAQAGYVRSATTEDGTDNLTSSSAGSGGSHNNVQPTIILNYIIKT